MNKTVTANIAGFIFNVEEQAYTILSEYLENIRSKFGDEQEREEIMRDIELRIAELFQNKIDLSKEVINLSDVEEVIALMGTPEDYASAEEEYENAGDTPKTRTTNKKKLFRDPDNAMLFGVCSGLAAYIGIDVLLVRIVFVILGFGGTGIIGYIILLFVIPEAKTTADKLRMRGEPVNVENIKQAFHNSKDDLTRHGKNASNKARKVANKGASAARKFFRIFGKVVGFCLIAFAITMSIILFSLFLGESGIIPLFGDGSIISYNQFMDIIFQNELQGNMMSIGLCLVIGIPILGAMFIGTKLLLGIKGSIKGFSVAATCSWIIGCILCAITGLQLGLEFQDGGSVDYNVELADNTVDTLYLDVSKDIHFSDNISYENGKQLELLKVDQKDILFGYPSLEIRKNEVDTNFSIQLIKESRGATLKQAILKAENLKYDIDTSQSGITFSPYFTSEIDEKWRAQTTTIIVWVPEGKTIHISKNLDRIMSKADNVNEVHSAKMVDHYWTMDTDNLKCLECGEMRSYSVVQNW